MSQRQDKNTLYGRLEEIIINETYLSNYDIKYRLGLGAEEGDD